MISPSTTFSFEVCGDSHEQITLKAKNELKEYVGTDDIDYIKYEINVVKNEENLLPLYKANIIARIKNGN